MNEPWNTLVGVFLGYLLASLTSWDDRRRKIKTHWRALRAEMRHCYSQANVLLADGIQAPLYRLPTSAYHASYPVLLAEGSVTESEIAALSEYFSLVEEINRGLDNAAIADQQGPSQKLQREADRNRLKARHLVTKENDNSSKYEIAFEVVNKKSE